MTPTLVLPSVTLRRFVPGDAERVYAMSREPAMSEWLPDQVYDSLEEARDVLGRLIGWCDDPGDPVRAPYVLGVEDPYGELIGHAGLSPFGDGVEVGYAIALEHQGRGHASEAVRALTDWALGRFDLRVVLGIASADNAASCRVLEKAGFVLVSESEGRLHGRSGLVRTYGKDRP